MIMRGQVGYWGSTEHGGLCIGFGQEMIEWLREQRCDMRVFVSVSSDRTVIVLPDTEGARVVAMSPDRNRSAMHYRSSNLPASLFIDLELTPFGLMEADFKDEEGGVLTFQLPPDHELPWPNVRQDCSTYPPDMLQEMLQVRMTSLIASGLTSFLPQHRMPTHLRHLLPRDAWTTAMATARTLSGISS